MRLRKQLFIASLFTLSLPWVGCQYVQEMEESLLSGQAEALKATAYAVTSTIESDPLLTAKLSAFNAASRATPVYLHPFYSPLTLDGYDEDWRSYGYEPQIFQARTYSDETIDKSTGHLAVFGGRRGDQAWLFIKVPSTSPAYHRPGNSLESAHRLKLSLQDANGTQIERIIVSSGPGSTQSVDPETMSNDHRISGILRESRKGFQIELQLPFKLMSGGFGFEYLPAKENQALFSNIALQGLSELSPPQPNYISDELAQKLRIFERKGIRLGLSSGHKAVVASVGKLAFTDYGTNSGQPQEAPWLLSLMYRIALGDKHYPELPSPEDSGFFNQSEVLESLSGSEAGMRYSLNRQTVSTISVPIRNNQRVIGAVLVEQTARSLSNLTDQAFSRLLAYSIAVSFGSALLLVLYASWLSIRIRRLSRSAAEAISESGKINEHFKSSKVHDEVGDLSRSFAQLLARLKEYTHYLRTLSSKLSHELRTPLAIVSSSLDNLEHEELSKQARTYAIRAKEGTARLSSILNSMSAASRVEQAIGHAELEQVPLDEMLQNLRDAYADIYAQVEVKLNIQSHKEGFSINAAGELLVQMLDKLVDNAADFCPNGGLIELGLYRQQQQVVITVRNEGPPLPKTMHRQLFDSMVSVRESNTPVQSGDHHLGLGLYIVRLIVDFHQGSVQGYNVPDDSGVIFEIRLPCER